MICIPFFFTEDRDAFLFKSIGNFVVIWYH